MQANEFMRTFTQQRAESAIQELRQASRFKEGYHQGLHYLRFFPWSTTLKEEVAFCCFWQDEFSRGLELLNDISLDDVPLKKRKEVEGRLHFNKHLFETRLGQPSPAPIVTVLFETSEDLTRVVSSTLELCDDMDLVHRWVVVTKEEVSPLSFQPPPGFLLEVVPDVDAVTTPFVVVVRQALTTRFSIAQMLEILETEPMISHVLLEHATTIGPILTTRFGSTWTCRETSEQVSGLTRVERVLEPKTGQECLVAALVCHECYEGVTPSNPPRFKSFVINLDRRPDRMVQMEQQRQLLPPFERVSAVDGMSLKPSPRLRSLCLKGDYKMRPGVIGCALSHLKLFKQLLMEEPDVEGYVVFEDDVDAEPGFVDRLNRVLTIASHVGAGLVFLTSVPLKPGTPYSQTGLVKRQPFMWSEIAGGTGCYYISRSVAKDVLDYVEVNGVDTAIDMILIFRLDVGQRVCLAPVITQYGVDEASDIQHDHHIPSHLLVEGDISQFKVIGPDGAIDFDDEIEAP